MDECEQCGGFLMLLGALGRRRWYRCQDCGWQEGASLDDLQAEVEIELGLEPGEGQDI